MPMSRCSAHGSNMRTSRSRHLCQLEISNYPWSVQASGEVPLAWTPIQLKQFSFFKHLTSLVVLNAHYNMPWRQDRGLLAQLEQLKLLTDLVLRGPGPAEEMRTVWGADNAGHCRIGLPENVHTLVLDVASECTDQDVAAVMSAVTAHAQPVPDSNELKPTMRDLTLVCTGRKWHGTEVSVSSGEPLTLMRFYVQCVGAIG